MDEWKRILTIFMHVCGMLVVALIVIAVCLLIVFFMIDLFGVYGLVVALFFIFAFSLTAFLYALD